MIRSAGKLKILIIDESPDTLTSVSIGFKLRWPECIVLSAREGLSGVALVESELPHLVITEIDLPDTNGFEVIRQLRLFSDVPIIVLSHRREEMEVVRALELGADEYLFKPLSTLDFLARARALLRRSSVYPHINEDLPPFIADSLAVDFASKQVTIHGKPVHLTPTEYAILCHLVRNVGRVVTIDTLRNQIWGDAEDLRPSTIRKSVSQLRHKLDSTAVTNMILNERGMGYRFVCQRQPARAPAP